MNVQDIMTRNPACCTPETALQDVAQMMVEHDCGEIPVVQNRDDQKLLGVVTDRDIVCRTVATGKNPLDLAAQACMSSPAITVTPQTSVEDCCQVMEANKIRRVPVVDQNGACCGIVSQADIANRGTSRDTAELVREVSQPTKATRV